MKTIVAQATCLGNCAIHIIRLSGDRSYEILQKICKEKIIKKGYELQYVHLVYNNETIDDVILAKYVAPRSYTGQDLIEINCHGSLFLAQKIIQILIRLGATMAQRGEFTLLAYLNNKLDIVQSESINNLVNSQTDYACRLARNGIDSKLTKKLQKLSHDIFQLWGKIEINIDYPEYQDQETITNQTIVDVLADILPTINEILSLSVKAQKIYQGIKIALVGQPNVGKSSLLNLFAGQEKAIVSSIPGTTRDIVEHQIMYNGFIFHIFDTAGIRDKPNFLEKKGIKKSWKIVKEVDLVLLITDISKNNPLTKKIYQKLPKEKTIVIENKSDLNKKQKFVDSVLFSCKKDPIAQILNVVIQKLQLQDVLQSDQILLQNTRQIGLLQQIQSLVQQIIKLAKKASFVDLLADDFQQLDDLFHQLLDPGKDNDFLTKLFSNFCLGK